MCRYSTNKCIGHKVHALGARVSNLYTNNVCTNMRVSLLEYFARGGQQRKCLINVQFCIQKAATHSHFIQSALF